MDESIKASIEARRIAFENSYELTSEYKKKVETLFNKITEFAKTCKDSIDFETKFASSSLNKEYSDLFVEIGTNCKFKKQEVTDDVPSESKGSKVLKEVSSDAKYLVDDITMPARRQARMKMDSKLRDTPYGKIEQASNMFHLFKRLKPRKKVDEQIENEE